MTNPGCLPSDEKYLSDSSGVYICKSIVNYLRHGNYTCKSEGNVPDIRTSYRDSSGVYICKSIVNYLRHM